MIFPELRRCLRRNATIRLPSMPILRVIASLRFSTVLTLTRTNVPAIAMSFSDIPFAYGPFVPHWVPKQYIENYFSAHKTDSLLVLNTTVEDVSKSPAGHRWSVTLRQHDSVARLDRWWREEFDAVIIANGHYSVPFVGFMHSWSLVC
jgi:hypothetical protein